MKSYGRQSLVKQGKSQSRGATWQAHRMPRGLSIHVIQLTDDVMLTSAG
jgi:hypothetical protein